MRHLPIYTLLLGVIGTLALSRWEYQAALDTVELRRIEQARECTVEAADRYMRQVMHGE